MEMSERATAHEVRSTLSDVLSKDGLQEDYAYSPKTDNGSNVVKTGEIIRADIPDLDSSSEQSLVDEDLAETESVQTESDGRSLEEVDEQLESNVLTTSIGGSVVSVRRTSQTIQLAVRGLLKMGGAAANLLPNMWAVAVKTHPQKICLVFSKHKKTLQVLDADTR